MLLFVRRPRYRFWGPLLLLVGGVAFGVVGYRTIALEREVSERGRALRMEVILAHLKADAARLGRAPRARPLAHWRIEDATMAAATGEPPVNHWPRLRSAAGHEHEPDVAVPRLEALLHADMPLYVRHAAAMHLAPLIAAKGRSSRARALAEFASEAHPALLDAHDPPARVRSQALAWIALDDLARERGDGLRAFLDDAEDGVRIVEGEALGPARLLDRLFEEAAKRKSEITVMAHGEPNQLSRLEAARLYALQGLAALRRLPGDGAYVGTHGWFLRRGQDIWRFRAADLLEPTPGRPVVDIHVNRYDTSAEVGPRSVRLDPPFESIVMTVRGEARGREGLVAALVLGLGLLVYAGGSVLVLRGWRRTQAAARQQAEFMASVSHEMKTPIASVRAMAELLADDGGADPDRTRLYAERIETEMQRLGGSVRNVLDAAQIERGALPVVLRPGDPAAIVEKAAQAVAPAMEKRGFEFRWHADPTDGSFLLDPEALEGVVLNFLDNAMKFSLGEKHVELRGRGWSDGRYRISVLDRGPGLDPEEQRRVFDRFYRGAAARDGAAPGVGLGLHIARQVAAAHGADLRASSREGGGAAFHIELYERTRPGRTRP